jgi:hypothetical protein
MIKSLGTASSVAGTNTNNNAAAGTVGEFVTATVASPGASISTGTPANVTSISLTAGDWDVSATLDFAPAATTTITQLNASISLTTGALASQAGGGGLGTDPTTTWNQASSANAALVAIVVPPVRISIAATTTVFLVQSATFATSTMTAYGTIRARRMR